MFTAKRFSVLLVVVASALALFLGVPVANASTIPLLNPSFESPVIPASPGYVAETPDNWNLTASGGTGVYVKSVGGAEDGSQFAEVASTAYLWQNTGVVLQTGDTVSLSAYAHHDTTNGTSKLQMKLWDATDSSSKGTAFLGNEFVIGNTWPGSPYTLSGVCDSSVNGTFLTVSLGGYNAQWTDIDAVSLAVTHQSPEPSAIVLTVTGLLGLLCYAWRKRK